MRLLILPATVFTALLLWDAPVAQSDEICVRCTGPAQTYRCTVQGDDAPKDLRGRGFYCASRIAEDEHHASCAAVRREMQCQGEPRSYVFDAAKPLPGVLAHIEEPVQEEVRDKEKAGPPETVEELTRETARRTGESLEKAADQTVKTTRGIGEQVRDAVAGAAGAVDRAARGTVKCIGSWFDDC